MRDVARKFNLSKAQQRQLHDEVSGEGLGYHEIVDVAERMFGDG